MAPDSSPQLIINWPDLANERGHPMLWLATWLIGAGGEDADPCQHVCGDDHSYTHCRGDPPLNDGGDGNVKEAGRKPESKE